jgi:hypothetical protein
MWFRLYRSLNVAYLLNILSWKWNLIFQETKHIQHGIEYGM